MGMTRNQRASAVGLLGPYRQTCPAPDSAGIATPAQRAFAAFSYAAASFVSPVPPPPPPQIWRTGTLKGGIPGATLRGGATGGNLLGGAAGGNFTGG